MVVRRRSGNLALIQVVGCTRWGDLDLSLDDRSELHNYPHDASSIRDVVLAALRRRVHRFTWDPDAPSYPRPGYAQTVFGSRDPGSGRDP